MGSVSVLFLLLILSAFPKKKKGRNAFGTAGFAIRPLTCFRVHPIFFLLNRSYVSVEALQQVLQKVEMDARCKQAITRVRTGFS